MTSTLDILLAEWPPRHSSKPVKLQVSNSGIASLHRGHPCSMPNGLSLRAIGGGKRATWLWFLTVKNALSRLVFMILSTDPHARSSRQQAGGAD